MTVGEGLRLTVESGLGHLVANERSALEGHPEAIHQTRVAIRRLRAALRAFKSALPGKGPKALGHELRWALRSLGPARDWHVFADETVPRLIEDGIAAELTGKLRRIGSEERRRHTLEASACLESGRFRRLPVRLQHWMESLEAEDPRGRSGGELLPLTGSVLDRTHRELLADDRPLTRMPVEDLHQLRIRAKRIRYAAEFFHSLYPAERSAPYIRALSRLQDTLGTTHDASVGSQLLVRLEPHRVSSAEIAAVTDWSENRVLTCTHAAQPEWRGLGNIEPFWSPGPKNDERQPQPW